MLNYSINSNPNSITLSRLQNSILNEERRLRFGQSTINYSINSLQFEDIPSGLPAQLSAPGTKCMHLSGYGFYQMLTYTVWQFLLTNRSQQKNNVITKLRKLIVHKEFMETSPSTKGLIVKGIKQMHDYVQLSSSFSNPIAHCMWRTDSMLAFTEFWKSLLARQSVRNIINAEESQHLQKSIFQLLSQFLQISITIYYQSSSTQFEKQHYNSTASQSNKLNLNLLIYSKKQHDRILRNSNSRMADTQSLADDQSVLQSLEWEYVVFSEERKRVAKLTHSELSREDISEINKVDESVQDEKEEFIKLFKLKTKSELNLQRLGDDLHNEKDEIFSPVYSSHVREDTHKQGHSTTRTKKSVITNDPYSCNRRSTFVSDKADFEETQAHLQNIKSNMMRGEKLIQDMKQFCGKIMV